MKRGRILTVMIVLLIAVILTGVRQKRARQKNSAPTLQPVPTVVRTLPVRSGTVDNVQHVIGEVRGEDELEIASRVVATVDDVLVREGDRVSKGQVLVRLDHRELEEAEAQAEADLESATEAKEVQVAATSRDKVLFENTAISQEQWERSQSMETAARSRVRMAQARVDQSRTRMEYCVLRAPVDGVVTERHVDPGDLAVVGHRLLRVVRQAEVRVRAKVPAALIGEVSDGSAVDLTLGDATTTAVVSRVFPAMHGDHLGTIEVDLADPPRGFVAGATVGVDVHFEAGSGMIVSLDALLEGSQGARVFRVEGGSVIHVIPVEIGTRSFHEAIVTGDLNVGDELVVARPSRLMRLSDGMAVKVASEESGR